MNRRLLVLFTLVLTSLSLLPAASLAQNTSSTPATIFSDVDTSSRYADAIQYLKSQNVIQGYSDGTFKPDAKINRAEFIKILIGAKYSNLTGKNCFPDVADQWFAPYICKAKELNVVQGYPDGTFRPDQNITFAEAAKIIAKTFLADTNLTESSDQWFKVYVQALDSVSDIPLSVEYFDQEITRDEMAEMIWRIKASIKKASRSYHEIEGDQPYTVKTCSELEERYLDVANRYNPPYIYQPMMETTTGAPADVKQTQSAPAPAAAPTTSGGAAVSTDHSTTNLQVAGVDEGDIVKNDGRYIYLIKGTTIRIVDAYPASSMKDLVKFDFATQDSSFTPSDLYIDNNTLVILGSSYNYGIAPATVNDTTSTLMMPVRNPGRVKAYVLDITDRTKPKVTRSVEFEGYLNTSRKVNDTLYLAINYSQYYPIPYYGIYRPQTSDFGLYLPQIKDSVVGKDEQVVPCDQIHIIPKNRNFNYLITAAIPLHDLTAAIARSVVIGGGDNVYASEKNLYVADTDYSGPYFAQSNTPTTSIYRFGLSPSSISFNGTGTVSGTVLNQFSMDENGNYFRLATQEGGWDSSTISNSVYILNSALQIAGKVTGLTPGEKLYAARFMGNRAFLVSFLSVDPLLVIDLQDPASPHQVGQLTIPGFSDYLEPYDENHLIGFGQDVDANVNASSPVTYESLHGMKIGLFDITNPAKPKQLYSELIGDRGTYSEVLYNHKALLFDHDKNLLAFPVSVSELPPDANKCSSFTYSTCPTACNKICVPTSCTTSGGVRVCSTDCNGPESCQQTSSYPQTDFIGAYVYNISLTSGFTLKGKITHLNTQEQADLLANGWGNYEKTISRVLYIGNSLYTVSQDIVQANDLSSLTFQNSVDLGPTSYDSYPVMPMSSPASSGSGTATPVY